MPLTAYYFNGQDSCVVRHQVREDLEWMADAGTDNVAVGVHEFQLDRLGSCGLEIICSEAERVGIKVHAIASRWAGLIAGWPTAAGIFSATHPEAWIRNADGTPLIRNFAGGAICSIYHPATLELYQTSINRMLDQWPFAGVIWDEPKTLEDEDHSEAAIKALGAPSTGETHVRHMAEFFSKATRHARAKKPDLTISCFVYAHFSDLIMRHFAAIDGLDYFGIDGLCRPNPGTYPRYKTVFGNMDRANAACKAAGVKSMCLIETGPGIPLEQTIGHVKDFLKTPVDHLMYYYYGSCTSPMERYMREMKTVVRDWRQRQG
ncbi:MAG: hypothetical protein K8T26_17480 [Lentisphaerae bacterium]|nr:hypothetical protein [Lentisphaerota bacterium]